MAFLPLSIILIATISSHKFVAIALQDTLSRGQILRQGETICSPKGTFALGFFQPSDSPSAGRNPYLGIWYNNMSPKVVVWVANRERSIADFDTYLTIQDEGNIALVDSISTVIWFSPIPRSVNNSKVMLLDTGNLVLQRGDGQILWQSFDYPTDTILPGMILRYSDWETEKSKLIAWKNNEDPSPGNVFLRISSLQIMIFNQSTMFWSSGPLLSPDAIESLVNPVAGELPVSLLSTGKGENLTLYFTVGGSNLVRAKLDYSGKLSLLVWQDNVWNPIVSAPLKFCDSPRACGPWGSCDNENCSCLEGFKPIDKTDKHGGCVREVSLKFTPEDKFITVENTKLPDQYDMKENITEVECRNVCLHQDHCTAYAYSNTSIRRDGQYCLVWKGYVTGLTGKNTGWGNISIRLDSSSMKKKERKFLLPLLLSAGGLVFVAVIIFFAKKINSRMCFLPAGEGLVGWDTNVLKAVMLEDVDFSGTNLADKGLFEAPLVDFRSVRRATYDFSDTNKIGSGGFGSVYKGRLFIELSMNKGKLINGNEVAVKRLSAASRQGQREFATEVKLIAKLQHKNLVRLIGWSTDKDEKILIYEYMPNKSLDMHIFGRSAKLSWDRRFSIIEGIADGLAYLHHHSRVRVIHRDLKTSNILLDSEMTPKISDFGLARIIHTNQTQGNTRKVAGTLGYMSPEYALDGIFSEKSDVFSFGVILLEIITGKRNTGYYSFDDIPNLVRYVWQLWSEGRVVELLSPPIQNSNYREKALKCIQLGLLCAEENAADRPSMNSVVSMLTSPRHLLPVPKQPGFSLLGRALRGGRSSEFSVNLLTDITMEPR